MKVFYTLLVLFLTFSLDSKHSNKYYAQISSCLKTANEDRLQNSKKLLPIANAEVQYWKNKGFDALLWGSVNNGTAQENSDIDIFIKYPSGPKNQKQDINFIKKIKKLIEESNGKEIEIKSYKEVCGLYTGFKYKKENQYFDVSFHYCFPKSNYEPALKLDEDMKDLFFCLNGILKNMQPKHKMATCLLNNQSEGAPSLLFPEQFIKGNFVPSVAVKVKKVKN